MDEKDPGNGGGGPSRDGSATGGNPQRPPLPPVFGVPETALRRFRARMLDPNTAQVLGDEPRSRPVAYVPHRVVVPGLTGPLPRPVLAVPVRLGYEDRLGRATHPDVELVPNADRVGPPLDAWDVLQEARRGHGKATRGWGLNHILMSSGYYSGVG